MDDYRQRTLDTSYWPAWDGPPLRVTTLGDALRDMARQAPDRLALVEELAEGDGRSWTYAKLAADAQACAQALLVRFKPGERVAFWAHNLPEWIVGLYGCAMAGITLVTVNPAYKARELAYVLGKSQAAGLFVNTDYRGHDLVATARAVAKDLPALREIIPLDTFSAFLREGQGGALPDVAPTDPAVIMFTSGTTGAQKGVIFTHMGVANMARYTQARAGLEEGGVFVNAMPMFHIGSMGHAGIGTVMLGATHVLVPEWNPVAFMRAVERHGGTYSLLVPVMIEQLLAHPDRESYNLSTLKSLTSGASVVEAQLIRRIWSSLGATISNIYGQTEMHGSITGTHPDDSPEDAERTIGQPLPHVELRVADPTTGETVPLNTQGEIQSRGYQNMIAYFDMAEETAATITPEGWLRSGDLGEMDARGFFKITGRIKDMIIRGGENIYPREVEEVLMEAGGLATAAVIGIFHPEWGEEVGAVLQPMPGVTPDPDALFARCRAELAHYKAPRLWYVVDQMPMTETGKLQKFRLVDEIASGRIALVKRT
ncbi:class I adenylate-forming enzyme family protein [Mesobacterium pallidum]|uniref:class I adenylate-forming enzyme family protein n=1 Tax=Mesobacterium pallidum TaxID=2872037 RepID=UPI001EE1DFFD|nr:AMP-binding protein [Mesobacterium pallidum]